MMPPEFAALRMSKEAVAERADALLPAFRDAINNIPPEAGFGGIWESEMFLFFAAAQPCAPGQILESGRARGKSTFILARCFPQARVVSVELERETPNAAAAEEKLKQCDNVELLYGDSRKILPEYLQPRDAVLIDGPKDFRGIELALELLRTRKPCVVFVHDFPPGAPWRRFVERHWPGVFFGDDPLFERFRILDQGRDPRTRIPAEKTGNYGIFACFPPGLPKPYWRLRIALFIARFCNRNQS
jgi:predicted O-methyltransferase YrrM